MDSNKHMTVMIGEKIRELRMAKGWKQVDLADRSGVSMAMLSKIENGRVFPTFPRLIQILKTLEVDLNEFFEGIGESEKFPGHILIKKEDHKETLKEESIGFKYETVLTQNIKDISLEISILSLSQNATREMVTTDGFEYIYVLKGSITYQLDGKSFKLEEGDSLYFDGRQPHVPLNNLETESILLVIYFITPL